MIPRIKIVEAREDFKLFVRFDDGREVLYDVKEDIAVIPDFKPLETTFGLWQQVQLDSSRTCVFWNDRIDLPSYTIYEFGEHLNDVSVAAELSVVYSAVHDA